MTTSSIGRDALRAQARELQGRGLNNVQIAAELGFEDKSGAWRLLNPEAYAKTLRKTNARRAPDKRAWENAYDRPTCACGTTMGVGAHRHGARACAGCRADMYAMGRAMRRERIYELWHRGALLREIAASLGSTVASIGVELVAMRQDGWDVPPRPPGGIRAERAKT